MTGHTVADKLTAYKARKKKGFSCTSITSGSHIISNRAACCNALHKNQSKCWWKIHPFAVASE